MADEFDPQAMVQRFRERAKAVRNRPLPPVEGPERRRFMEQRYGLATGARRLACLVHELAVA